MVPNSYGESIGDIMRAEVNPVIDSAVRKLCTRPYYNHPKGCPNHNKRSICPPQSPLLFEVFDMDKPIVAIWVAFNLRTHKKRMKAKHPNWSPRQLECCRYWQGNANKQLRQQVEYALINYQQVLPDNSKRLLVTYIPEAMGVNVTETMKNINVILEWPPKRVVRKIAFIGCSLKGK